MTTVRKLEKLYKSRNYARLAGDLLVGRPENSLRLASVLTTPLAAAALAVVRLDELGLSHAALSGKLLRTILFAQDADGGWSDPLATTLCLRALLTSRGQGASIDRGMGYLANLQKPEGIWPSEPIRRLPADAFVSAFVLFHLGPVEQFRDAVRFGDAITWFAANERSLDAESRRLWDLAKLRCRIARADQLSATLWS